MLIISMTKNDTEECKYKYLNQIGSALEYYGVQKDHLLGIRPNMDSTSQLNDIITNVALFSTVYLSHKLQYIFSYINLYEVYYLGVISLLCPVSLLSSNVVS